jgi:hypothetical protein
MDQKGGKKIYQILKKKLLSSQFPIGTKVQEYKQEDHVLEQQFDELSPEHKTMYKDIIRLRHTIMKNKDLAVAFLQFLIWMKQKLGHYDQHMTPIVLPAFIHLYFEHKTQDLSAVTGAGFNIEYRFILQNYEILQEVVKGLVRYVQDKYDNESCKIPSNLTNFDFKNKKFVEVLLWQNLGDLFKYLMERPFPNYKLFVISFASECISNREMFDYIKGMLEEVIQRIPRIQSNPVPEIQPDFLFPLRCILFPVSKNKVVESIIGTGFISSVLLFLLL